MNKGRKFLNLTKIGFNLFLKSERRGRGGKEISPVHLFFSKSKIITSERERSSIVVDGVGEVVRFICVVVCGFDSVVVDDVCCVVVDCGDCGDWLVIGVGDLAIPRK